MADLDLFAAQAVGAPDPTERPVLSPEGLADVARTRERDGNLPGGLERAQRMQRFAERVHDEDNDLSALRPDLADASPTHQPSKGRTLMTLIRPTGPVRRLSTGQVLVVREKVGLDEPILTKPVNR